MRPRMQVSFLSDCDDVALPALKLDPDAEMVRVVLADVEVRQRAVLHDVECSCDDPFHVSRWIAISVSSFGAFLDGNGRGKAAALLRACSAPRLSKAMRNATSPCRGSPTRSSTNERFGIKDSARERHGLFRCGAFGAACVAVHRSNIREWHPPRPEQSSNIPVAYSVPPSVSPIRIG